MLVLQHWDVSENSIHLLEKILREELIFCIERKIEEMVIIVNHIVQRAYKFLNDIFFFFVNQDDWLSISLSKNYIIKRSTPAYSMFKTL